MLLSRPGSLLSNRHPSRIHQASHARQAQHYKRLVVESLSKFQPAAKADMEKWMLERESFRTRWTRNRRGISSGICSSKCGEKASSNLIGNASEQSGS